MRAFIVVVLVALFAVAMAADRSERIQNWIKKAREIKPDVKEIIESGKAIGQNGRRIRDATRRIRDKIVRTESDAALFKKIGKIVSKVAPIVKKGFEIYGKVKGMGILSEEFAAKAEKPKSKVRDVKERAEKAKGRFNKQRETPRKACNKGARGQKGEKSEKAQKAPKQRGAKKAGKKQKKTEEAQPEADTDATSNCGMAFQNGQQLGNKQCVMVQGKPVVVETAIAFEKMNAAAKAAGIHLQVNSGFRTQKEQEYLYNCYKTKKCNNGNLAARPGYSNHQNGRAMDISCSNPKVFSWMSNNASKFGFIRTVPSENWHWELLPGRKCNSTVKYTCK